MFLLKELIASNHTSWVIYGKTNMSQEQTWPLYKDPFADDGPLPGEVVT